MTEIVIDRSFGLLFDTAARWSFYTNEAFAKYYYNESDNSGVDFDRITSQSDTFINSELYATINGVNIKVSLDAEGNFKQMTGGAVTDIFFYLPGGNAYITGLELKAVDLAKLMSAKTVAASTKIFNMITAGDDEVTLSFGKDIFAAGAGDDVVRGRSGNDKIDGGEGDDVIYGGTGKDALHGGTGADIFVFDTKAGASNVDTIDDFSAKDDLFSLDHHIFRALKINADADDGWFLSNSTGKAKDSGDHLIYNSKTGELSYDADGSGAAKSVVIAQLTKGLKIIADHFDIF